MATMLAAQVARAESARISWVVAESADTIQSPIHPNEKKQAEEIYRDSIALLEERMEWAGRPLRPRITVHVGESCPAREMVGPCMNPALGVLYVDEWNDEAREALARITMLTAMQQIMQLVEQERFI
jgi:hypothetical protein